MTDFFKHETTSQTIKKNIYLFIAKCIHRWVFIYLFILLPDAAKYMSATRVTLSKKRERLISRMNVKL